MTKSKGSAKRLDRERGGSNTTSQRRYIQEGFGYVKTVIIVFRENVKRENRS